MSFYRPQAVDQFSEEDDGGKIRVRDERLLWLAWQCQKGRIWKSDYEATFYDVGERTFYRDLQHVRDAAERFGFSVAKRSRNGVFPVERLERLRAA